MNSSPGHELVRLPNGVFSIRSLAYGEILHPSIGPVAEAEALYVEQLKLRERLRQHDGEFVIWDVGLGAAANALTVLRATREVAVPLRLASFDKTTAQLEFALAHMEALGYLAGYEEQLASLITSGHNLFKNADQEVQWQLHLTDFPTLLVQPLAQSLPKPHTILFDPHSPARNPEMWTLPLFTNLFRLLDPIRPCALATYSRSTMLRVTLLLAGFFVGAGRASGRKEETTIAANTLELLANPLTRDWLARARRSDSAEPLRGPVYCRAPLVPESWEKLRAHPQFSP